MDNTNDTTQPGEGELNSSDGGASVTPTSEGLTLERLNQELGKEFKTEDDALKAIKDTNSYVGKLGKYAKLGDAIAAVQKTHNVDEDGAIKIMQEQFATGEPTNQPDPNNFVSRQEFEDATFYAKHPELEASKPLIEAFRSKPENQGKPLAEVVESDETLKSTLNDIAAGRQAEEAKSVMNSNPRLGQATDKLAKAREAAQTGNFNEADSLAVGSVLDAFENQ